MFQFSLEISLVTVFTAINIQRAESHVGLYLNRQLLLSNFNWNWNGRKIFIKRSSIKYYEKNGSPTLEMLLMDRGASDKRQKNVVKQISNYLILFIVKYVAFWCLSGPYRRGRHRGHLALAKGWDPIMILFNLKCIMSKQECVNSF